MLSRIFWVGIAGIALVAGIALQDGNWIFGSGDRGIDVGIDRTVDRTVDRAVDRSVDRMQVVGPDGQQIAVSPDTKRALAEAVGRLVKAEADLAVLRVRGGDSPELQAAIARRAHTRAEVDRLKAEVRQQEQLASVERDALRDQIRREVRDEIREAARN
jgi:aminopeptidase N